jgi:hypothetical protein
MDLAVAVSGRAVTYAYLALLRESWRTGVRPAAHHM